MKRLNKWMRLVLESARLAESNLFKEREKHYDQSL